MSEYQRAKTETATQGSIPFVTKVAPELTLLTVALQWAHQTPIP